MTVILLLILVPILTTGLMAAGAWLLIRRTGQRLERSMGERPERNLWEMLFTLRSRSLSSLLMTMQRAESGQPAEHPMGSRPTRDWLNVIGIDPATLGRKPLGRDQPVDLTVQLGPLSEYPLTLSMPVLIAPMGFGLALSAETKVALAQAASLAGTAASSGEGPYLPEERAYAERWILQESRGGWAHQPSVRGLADMIELQWGQGSEGGKEVVKAVGSLPERALEAADGPVVIGAAGSFPLEEWVRAVRAERPDCPLGIKLPASQHLEEDLAYIAALPIDVITLDAAGAGSAGSPSVISDHFGVPIALAAHRAHQWLTHAGLRNQVSLIVSGGVQDAADIACLIALGADAIAVGSELLLAALHQQVARKLPKFPPTELAFARSSKNQAPRLDVNQASEHAANWLSATREELKSILRTAGLPSLADWREYRPLIAQTVEAAGIFGIPFVGSGPQMGGRWAAQVGALAESYGVLNYVLMEIGEDWDKAFAVLGNRP